MFYNDWLDCVQLQNNTTASNNPFLPLVVQQETGREAEEVV